MTTTKNFINRHPVVAYYALMFAISWGGTLLIIGGPQAIPATGEQIGRLMIPVMVPWLAASSIAGILLTGLLHGRAGLREFGSQLLKWRVGVGWYALAILTAPALMAAILLALSLLSPDFLPRIYTTDDKQFLLGFSFASALFTAFFEELGVTGFAVPELRRRYGVLSAGLIAGFVWGVWRSLVVIWVGGVSGEVPAALFYPLTLFTWLPAFRVLMVWVYDRTGSLLIAILMHTSLVTFWTMLTPLTILGERLLVYYFVLAAAFWAVVAALALIDRRQLARENLRQRMA